jgi:two-component system phosphate regulon sensor histidine kinase PhoR
MEYIIDDLLLLSKVRSANKEMRTEKFPLHEVVAKVYDGFMSAAKNKDIKMEPARIEPVFFNGKNTLIERLVTNVIDNAIRYTASGGSIRLSLLKKGPLAELTITDTGIGIPKESLSLIFDRFYVVDKSRSKENGGTGLGLAIVKWIADNHNIEIQVHSQPKIGSTFTFLFPLS